MWRLFSIMFLSGVVATAQMQSSVVSRRWSGEAESMSLQQAAKSCGRDVRTYTLKSTLASAAFAAQSSGTPPIVTPETKPEGFHWGGALKQSGLLLGIQHSLRMVQAKTRMQLGGNWWDDYKTSLDRLSGWNDGNPIITNYVGHPIMGAVTGFIQIQNDPRGASLEWSPHDRAYWKSRSKALGWAALYSTQYELGPAGEAMIGNVGLDRGTMAYVDLVVTPIGGFGMLLLEDWLDKRVIEKVEQGKSDRKMRFFRVVMNPSRSLANMLRFKRPSYRENR